MGIARQGFGRRLGLVALLALLLCQVAGVGWLVPQAAAATISLAPDQASGQPVGTTVTWTATPPDGGARTYRFLVSRAGQAPVLARDFAPEPTFSWTALDEGDYAITVVARDDPAGPGTTTLIASAPYRLASRVVAGRPVVSATANPLVALYSIPPCGTGTVQVIFGTGADAAGYRRTPVASCSPTVSTNLYLVGMRPSTTHTIQYAITEGGATRYGPLDSWTTGAIPAALSFPTITTPVPAGPEASLEEGLIYRMAYAPQPRAYATDLAGNITWYLPDVLYAARPLAGGNTLAQFDYTKPNESLRILDPAGNTLRETRVARLNEQIAALTPGAGRTIDPIRGLHHESNVLPDGRIVVLGYTERLYPPGTQGSTTGLPVDLVGDAILVLDQDLQLVWYWNAFDHFDVQRPATIASPCVPPGCAINLQYVDQSGGVAQDWLHSNAVSYSPNDGNLLLSVRHMDWIVKVDYRDGAGAGAVVWRLGNEGDFTLTNTPDPNDPFPWFSHQHAIELTPDGRLITFDNGNKRCEMTAICRSHGQVYQLDEQNRLATRIVNADTGGYSAALGWAQLLQNGNYAFTSGFLNGGAGAQVLEFDPTGTVVRHVIDDRPGTLYRGYRLATLYDGCCRPTTSPVPAAPSATPVPTGELALTVLGAGTVTRTPADGNTGPIAYYTLGSTVTLTAQPEPGQRFIGWAVDGASAGAAPTLTLTIDGARAVVARFSGGTAQAARLTVATTGGGTLFRTPAATPGEASEVYAGGTVVTLLPQAAAGQLFIGWRVDGVDQGWAPTLTLTMDADHLVEGRFAPRQVFADAGPEVTGATEAIAQLAARGIIRGCDPTAGLFCPTDPTLRAQMAALIVRAMGWGGETPANPFTDRAGVDDELWNAVAILADHGVAQGYGDGTYGTADPVLNVQVISFITRAMVDAGHWQFQPDDGTVYPNVPGDSGHRIDLATYAHYAGPVRGTASPTEDFGGWDQPSSRAYFAFALWQALESYFATDRVP